MRGRDGKLDAARGLRKREFKKRNGASCTEPREMQWTDTRGDRAVQKNQDDKGFQ